MLGLLRAIWGSLGDFPAAQWGSSPRGWELGATAPSQSNLITATGVHMGPVPTPASKCLGLQRDGQEGRIILGRGEGASKAHPSREDALGAVFRAHCWMFLAASPAASPCPR